MAIRTITYEWLGAICRSWSETALMHAELQRVVRAGINAELVLIPLPVYQCIASYHVLYSV